MAYSADTFVADEQPTTAKWNKLWSNDASFNDGTGIGDNTILARHMADNSVNPYTDIVFDGCILRKSADQTIGTGSITAVTWDTEDADTQSYHSTSSNTDRITVPKAGNYLFTYHAAFAANTTGQRYFWLAKNGGASDRRGYQLTSASSGDVTAATGALIINLAINDYINMQVYQNSGGNLALNGGATTGFATLSMYRLGS